MIIFLWTYIVLLGLGYFYFFVSAISSEITYKKNRRIIPNFNQKKISVLIPARNEEDNIRQCLLSYLNQDYSNYEIFVLNDNSTDTTFAQLETLQKEFPNRFVLINGKPLKDGWKGKVYALHQMYQKTTGEYLLCSDADMVASPNFLSWVNSSLQKHNADFLSGWVKHLVPSFFVHFLQSLVYLSPGFLYPLSWIWKLKSSQFTHAYGPIIAYKKKAMDEIGGYEVIRNVIVEDYQLARRFKKEGKKILFFDGQDYLRGYMFTSFSQAYNAIPRSLVEIFDRNFFKVFIAALFVIIYFVIPPLINIGLFLSGSQFCWIFLGLNLFFLLTWSIVLTGREMKWYLPFFYPVEFILLVILLFQGLFKKNHIWKGRRL